MIQGSQRPKPATAWGVRRLSAWDIPQTLRKLPRRKSFMQGDNNVAPHVSSLPNPLSRSDYRNPRPVARLSRRNHTWIMSITGSIENKVNVLIGENGAGKSTMMKMLYRR